MVDRKLNSLKNVDAQMKGSISIIRFLFLLTDCSV